MACEAPVAGQPEYLTDSGYFWVPSNEAMDIIKKDYLMMVVFSYFQLPISASQLI